MDTQATPNIFNVLKLNDTDREKLKGCEALLAEDLTKFLVEKLVEEMGDDEVNKIYEQTANEGDDNQIIDMVWREKWPQMEANREKWLEEYRQNFDADYFLKYYSENPQ